MSLKNIYITNHVYIESFCLVFEDLSDPQYNDEIEEIAICNMNTTLPSKLRGHEEDIFCRVISELCHKQIDRHDKKLFKTVDIRNKPNKVSYFMECHYKNNKCFVYPLKSGLFIQPKPMMFIPQTRIRYYEYSRLGDQLRYFDMDIILEPDEEEKKEKKKIKMTQILKKEKRDKSLEFELSMICKNDRPAIEAYFASLRIECKQKGPLPIDD